MLNTDFLSKLVSYLTGITSLSRMQGSIIYNIRFGCRLWHSNLHQIKITEPILLRYIHYLWSDSSCSYAIFFGLLCGIVIHSTTALNYKGRPVCASVCVPSTHPAVGPCSVEAHNSQRSGSPRDYSGRSVPPSPAAHRSSLKWQRTETGQRHNHANRLHHLQHLMDQKKKTKEVLLSLCFGDHLQTNTNTFY